MLTHGLGEGLTTSVECLVYKREDLSSVPSAHVTNQPTKKVMGTACKMVRPVNVFVMRPGDLSSILRTHQARGELF